MHVADDALGLILCVNFCVAVCLCVCWYCRCRRSWDALMLWHLIWPLHAVDLCWDLWQHLVLSKLQSLSPVTVIVNIWKTAHWNSLLRLVSPCTWIMMTGQLWVWMQVEGMRMCLWLVQMHFQDMWIGWIEGLASRLLSHHSILTKPKWWVYYSDRVILKSIWWALWNKHDMRCYFCVGSGWSPWQLAWIQLTKWWWWTEVGPVYFFNCQKNRNQLGIWTHKKCTQFSHWMERRLVIPLIWITHNAY